MRNKIDIISSFFFYGVGLLSFLIADIYVIQNFTKENVAEWAFIKSLILISGSICLLGYDHVFLRDPSLIKRFFGNFNLQALAILLIIGFLIYIIKNFSIIKIISILFSIYLFALISYIAASFRATFNLLKSQFATNLWKILLCLTVVIIPWNNSAHLFLCSLLISVLSVLIVLKFHKLLNKDGNNTNIFLLDDKTAKKIGYAFVITNITLIFSSYGEQFLINLRNEIEVSSHLFKYFSIYTPIALSMNGFIAFYYGPKIRKENNMTISRYRKFSLNMFFYSVIITFISIVMGYLYMIFITKEVNENLDFLLIFSLAILCIVRGVYTSISVCLGIFGDAVLIKKAAYGMCCGSLLFVFIVLFILYFANEKYTTVLISLASVFNWTLRLLISNHYSYQTLKTIRNES